MRAAARASPNLCCGVSAARREGVPVLYAFLRRPVEGGGSIAPLWNVANPIREVLQVSCGGIEAHTAEHLRFSNDAWIVSQKNAFSTVVTVGLLASGMSGALR